MECGSNSRGNEKRSRRRKKSFTEALKEKYCMEDEPAFDFIIVSPKRKTNSSAELAHLQTVVLNDMDITRADIPRQGLVSLCPNVVDLDLANNLLETWSELLSILSHLPKVRYLNVSRNRLQLDLTHTNDSLTNSYLSVENLALNDTGTTIEEVVRLSQLMPGLKELHLCENNYEDLADIESNIHAGAFPCLECLRLNNNDISRWSEVWKLRHLPHLKCLVLSGNPIDNIFYHSEDKTDNRKVDATDLHNSTAGHCYESALQQTASRDVASKEEKRLRFHLADSDMDVNGECDSLVMDNFDQRDSEKTEETFGNDDVINAQPVGRTAFQTKAESLARSSSHHKPKAGIEYDSGAYAGVPSRIDAQAELHPNANNSCRVDVKKCLCDAYDGFDEGYFVNDDVFLENTLLENSSTGEESNVESVEWHRTVAEEFLHEIIDGINFDDILEQRVPEFPPSNYDQTVPKLDHSNYDQTVDANSILEDTEDSLGPNSISQASDIYNIESTPTKQQASVDRSSEICVAEHNNASAALDMDFGLGYSPVVSEIDAQFIPRAVRLFDDDVMSSFFYMVTPSPPRSRAQRCLFQEPVCNGSSHIRSLADTHYRGGDHQAVSDSDCHQSASDSCSDCHPSASDSCSDCHQSASDSCSDCEAEQHKREKTGQLIAPVMLANFLQQPPHQFNPSFPSNIIHTYLPNSESESSDPTPASRLPSSQEGPQMNKQISKCGMCEENTEFNNNSSGLEDSEHELQCMHTSRATRPVPFQHLQVLCLSSANLHHWSHLRAFSAFPKLTSLRLKNNPLYYSVNPEDRRKLYIASLPKVTLLNGSEVSHTEREKAERHYLRYFMDKEDKPDFYHTLVKKHGPPVKLVDIDLSAGYQEWANLKFVCKGVEEFSRKIHLVEPVGKLRNLISQVIKVPKRCFTMYHHSCGPSHPESERELVELRCESLPMSRFDFADGDEIHIDVPD
ncbi:unnamed protein product [Candidula unifasciata]|uniref:Tubulin-specific chaperone cofactor E-like protein n=1 Tax=Candidula unifasciata TaxID=100452 RepID=A0A8S3ZQU0_9EUPU|nr:unnamed protein product [Candidula unifasciata]